jgi:hypothetical protein
MKTVPYIFLAKTYIGSAYNITFLFSDHWAISLVAALFNSILLNVLSYFIGLMTGSGYEQNVGFWHLVWGPFVMTVFGCATGLMQSFRNKFIDSKKAKDYVKMQIDQKYVDNVAYINQNEKYPEKISGAEIKTTQKITLGAIQIATQVYLVTVLVISTVIYEYLGYYAPLNVVVEILINIASGAGLMLLHRFSRTFKESTGEKVRDNVLSWVATNIAYSVMGVTMRNINGSTSAGTTLETAVKSTIHTSYYYISGFIALGVFIVTGAIALESLRHTDLRKTTEIIEADD